MTSEDARKRETDELAPTPDEGARLQGAVVAERLEEEAWASIWRDNRRIIGLATALAGVVVLVHFTPLASVLEDAQHWKLWIREFGFLAFLGYGMAAALAVMFGVPRSVTCLAAGGLFGSLIGIAVSWVSSTAGSYGAFLLARWGARRPDERTLDRWPWLRELLAAPSVASVAWLRQLPLPGLMLNLMLGVTTARHRVFLAGTLLGYLPLNIAFALVGSGLGKADLVKSLGQFLGAIAVVNLVALLVWRQVKKHRSQRCG
jgi:uncharacterized membrane protein YdjX (TVP38/TMEM64 family)